MYICMYVYMDKKQKQKKITYAKFRSIEDLKFSSERYFFVFLFRWDRATIQNMGHSFLRRRGIDKKMQKLGNKVFDCFVNQIKRITIGIFCYEILAFHD